MSEDASSDKAPTPPVDETGMKRLLGYQLAQASVVTNRVFATRVGQAFELRSVEFTVLLLVAENPGVSASRLAEVLAVTPPNITMWIDKLESRGLVERERNPSDRRAQHIRATPRGQALARDAARSVAEGEAAALEVLSAGERAILSELLDKVARTRRRRP